MRIAVFEIAGDDQTLLETMLAGNEVVCTPHKLSIETAEHAQGADVVSVFVGSEVRKDVLDLLPSVKLIATRSMGFDHIDVAYAKEKGISVASVPAYGSHTVAEFAFALLLSVSRNIVPAHNALRAQNAFTPEAFTGFDLFGKTFGVVGTGKIGTRAIEIAKGFGMQVVAYDMFPNAENAARLGFSYVPLAELLASADVVSLHTPYTKETHHMFGPLQFSQMKKGSVLINTARGEIVDSEALLAALESGVIAGAGLDVVEGERYIKEQNTRMTDGVTDETENAQGMKTVLASAALLRHPRVVATPHMAFATNEARREIVETTAKNILQFILGTPQNILS